MSATLPFLAYPRPPEHDADPPGSTLVVADGCCRAATAKVLADPDGEPLVVEWHARTCPTWSKVAPDGTAVAGTRPW